MSFIHIIAFNVMRPICNALYYLYIFQRRLDVVEKAGNVKNYEIKILYVNLFDSRKQFTRVDVFLPIGSIYSVPVCTFYGYIVSLEVINRLQCLPQGLYERDIQPP